MSLLDNNPLSFIFGAKPGAGVPTYEQLQMRRKIAESLLGQKSKYPKTFGEGLGAIGDAIGERGLLREADAMAQAREAQVGPEYNRAMGIPASVSPSTPTGRPMSYAPEDAGVAPTAAAAATGSNVGSWNQFAQEQSPGGLGLAPAQAAGLVGNLQAESGANINPNAPPGDNGTAFGSAQWRGPRLAALQQYAATQGLDPMTTEAQQGFMRQEMIGQGNRMPTEGGAYSALTATNTPAGAATAVDRLYERSSGEHRGRRIENAQKIMRLNIGPQSSVVDPGLNQSVALNPAAPPPPSGPPMAFSGVPASDAPPVGMPTGQAPSGVRVAPSDAPLDPLGAARLKSLGGAPPDARSAIAGALAPKPPLVVAPPMPPAPAGPQIAQAPPQQQIRVPEREPIAPKRQVNPQINEIAALSGKLGPDDPRQQGLRLRYQQLQAIDEADYTQKFEEYKHKRDRWEAAPEKAAALGKAQQEADVAKRFGGPVPYQQFIADSSKSYEATEQLSNSMPMFRQAKQALAQSYTGSGSELKLDAGKMLRAMGVPGDYTPEVATELLQSRMKAIAGGMIKSTVGSQNISDADREFVEKAYSGNIKMEPESLRRLLSIAEDTTIRSINRHNDRLLSVANDPAKDSAIRNQYAVPMQYGDDAVAYLKAHPDTAAMFDKKYGKGHAKAVLSGGRYGD